MRVGVFPLRLSYLASFLLSDVVCGVCWRRVPLRRCSTAEILDAHTTISRNIMLRTLLVSALAALASGFAVSPSQPMRVAARGAVAASAITMEERTYIMIKPDGVQRGLVGKVCIVRSNCRLHVSRRH